jgi:hypothetical protein
MRMNSNRFVNLKSRRNFRVGVVVLFLLEMGVLAAYQARAQVPQRDDKRMMISSTNRNRSSQLHGARVVVMRHGAPGNAACYQAASSHRKGD